MRILGIDPSLRSTGLCVLEDDKIIHTEAIEIKKTPQDNLERMERIYKIVKRICEVIEEFKVDVVGLEQQYYMAGRRAVVISLSELIGSIKFAIYLKFKRAVAFSLTVAEIRKLTLGKAFHKDKVDIEMEKRLLPTFNDDNLRDAFLVAKAVAVLLWAKSN